MKRKRVKFKLFSPLFFLWLGFVSSFCFFRWVEAKTITIGGTFDDWVGVEKTITDSLEGYPFSGTTYYYNLASDSWQTSDPGTSTCMVNYDQMLDVGDIWVTNDNNYLYFKIRRGSDFTSYYWRRSGETEWGTFSDSAASSYNSNPCSGRIITTPAVFERSLVFHFDTDTDSLSDYYIVIDAAFDAGKAPAEGLGRLDEDFYSHTAYLYKDNGDGSFAESDEEKLATLGSGDYALSTTLSADEGGVLQEIKVDLPDILENFGISQEGTVGIHCEVSGSESGDITDSASYAVIGDNEIKLTPRMVDRTKKVKVRIAGKTVKGAAVNIFVDGIDQGTVRVKKNGKFSKKVPLSVGTNKMRIAAYNSVGTKSYMRSVTRQAVRAVDRDLQVSIIHSKDQTKKATITIWGKAYGVSRVQIAVNDFEWGWTIVNTKTGKYKTKVSLSEGANTIKVTATKNGETVAVTKAVEKI